MAENPYSIALLKPPVPSAISDLQLRHFKKMNINLAQANGVCVRRWQLWR
jgi:hypothetical protein